MHSFDKPTAFVLVVLFGGGTYLLKQEVVLFDMAIHCFTTACTLHCCTVIESQATKHYVFRMASHNFGSL